MPAVTLATGVWHWGGGSPQVSNVVTPRMTPALSRAVYQAIPQPVADVLSLVQSVQSLKHNMERLTGSGSTPLDQAATLSGVQTALNTINTRLAALEQKVGI